MALYYLFFWICCCSEWQSCLVSSYCLWGHSEMCFLKEWICGGALCSAPLNLWLGVFLLKDMCLSSIHDKVHRHAVFKGVKMYKDWFTPHFFLFLFRNTDFAYWEDFVGQLHVVFVWIEHLKWVYIINYSQLGTE